MRNALIVGGANGIGLSIATVLAERQDVGRIYIVDKSPVATERQQEKFMCYQFDLTCDDAAIRVIKHFYDKLLGQDDFRCGVMVSIAGFMSSPFFPSMPRPRQP